MSEDRNKDPVVIPATTTGSFSSLKSGGDIKSITKITSVSFTEDPHVIIIQEDDSKLLEERVVPPDGGWGWLIVLASFVSNLVVDGILYSFGILIEPIQKNRGDISIASVAWISSLASGFHLLIGPVTSTLSNRYGFRIVAVAGSGISLVGILGSWAICYIKSEPVLPALFVLYGFVGGIGLGMIYCPAILAVSIYFDKKRAFATGIAVCGSGIGVFIFPPITQAILGKNKKDWQSVLLFQASGALICGFFGLLYKPLKPILVKKQEMQLERDKAKNDLRRSFASPSGSVLLPLPSVTAFKRKSRLHSLHSNLKIGTGSDIISDKHRNPLPLKTASVGSFKFDFENADADSGKVIFFQPYFPYNESRGGSFSGSEHMVIDQKPPRSNSVGKSKGANASVTLKTGSLTDIEKPLVSDEVGTTQAAGVKIRQKPIYQNTASISSVGSYNIIDDSILKVNPSNHNINQLSKIPQGPNTLYNESLAGGSVLSAPNNGQENQETEIVLTEEDESNTTFCSSICEVLKSMINVSLLVSPTFIVLTVSGFFDMMAVGIPFMYLTDYAKKTLGNKIRDSQATFLISYIGVANTAGRILCGLVADHPRIDVVVVKNLALTIVGISILSVPFFNAYVHYVIFSCVFGFMLGCSAALRSALLVELLGIDKVVDAFGLKLLFQGIASLIGPPLAGLEYELTNSSYAVPFFTAGGFTNFAAVLCYPIYYIKRWEERRSQIKN